MDLANHPLTCKQGSKFQFFFTWKVKNQLGEWTPVNLTGWKARLVIRKDYQTSALQELTTENGRITLGGAAGTVDVRMPSATTTTLPVGVWIYDFYVIDPSNEPDQMLEGSFEVVK